MNEKIYNWMDSQLSIARFYGCIKLDGHLYVIDETDPLKPLVRQDVLEKPIKTKKNKELSDKEILTQLGLL